MKKGKSTESLFLIIFWYSIWISGETLSVGVKFLCLQVIKTYTLHCRLSIEQTINPCFSGNYACWFHFFCFQQCNLVCNLWSFIYTLIIEFSMWPKLQSNSKWNDKYEENLLHIVFIGSFGQIIRLLLPLTVENLV